MIDVIMYDSGACGLDNATALIARNLDYLFCLEANQPTLFAEVRRPLGSLPDSKCISKCIAASTDIVGGEVVTRRLFFTEAVAGYLDWTHLQTVIRIQCTRENKTTGKVTVEDHFYITSLEAGRLSGDEWIKLIRRRWSVENECHNTFDKIFFEDRRPWIMQPHGMMVLMLLRRLAYNILTLYRSVTLCSEANRCQPWRALMRTFDRSLTLATLEAIAGLRRRTVIAD